MYSGGAIVADQNGLRRPDLLVQSAPERRRQIGPGGDLSKVVLESREQAEREQTNEDTSLFTMLVCVAVASFLVGVFAAVFLVRYGFAPRMHRRCSLLFRLFSTFVYNTHLF